MSKKFLSDVELHGITTAKKAFNIDHTVQHIRLRDTDRADFSNHGFIIDMNSETGRLYFYENPSFYDKLRCYAPAHATQAHDIALLNAAGLETLLWDESDAQWEMNSPLILAGNPTALLGAATKQYVDGWLPVSATDADLTGSTISTTNGVKQSATLTIPASWNTYRILAWWSVGAFVSGTLGSQRTITSEIRLTNVSGTLIGRSRPVLGTAAQGFTSVFAGCNGAVGGQTATGSVVVVGCMAIANDSGQASWRDSVFTVVAHRLT